MMMTVILILSRTSPLTLKEESELKEIHTSPPNGTSYCIEQGKEEKTRDVLQSDLKNPETLQAISC